MSDLKDVAHSIAMRFLPCYYVNGVDGNWAKSLFGRHLQPCIGCEGRAFLLVSQHSSITHERDTRHDLQPSISVKLDTRKIDHKLLLASQPLDPFR
jgi:hypothetical protein